MSKSGKKKVLTKSECDLKECLHNTNPNSHSDLLDQSYPIQPTFALKWRDFKTTHIPITSTWCTHTHTHTHTYTSAHAACMPGLCGFIQLFDASA